MNRMKPRTEAEKDANPDDEAFYKQEFLRLREGFRFAVVAEIDSARVSAIRHTFYMRVDQQSSQERHVRRRSSESAWAATFG